jgi:hypothetical protein
MSTDLAMLAKRLVDCAAAAQAREDNLSLAPSVLKHYREDARTVTAAVLQALLPIRKKGVAVTLELPDLGRIPLADLIVAVERVEVP